MGLGGALLSVTSRASKSFGEASFGGTALWVDPSIKVVDDLEPVTMIGFDVVGEL
jgi:hypothetical protein